MEKRRSSLQIKGSRKFASKTLKCVACSHSRDAEVLHPDLRIPICGTCFVSCEQRDRLIRDRNEESCVMCGTGDDNELMMCDTCPKSFCSVCIDRNFGTAELQSVRDAYFWGCYLCSVESLLSKLQVDEGTVFYSLDNAYAEIKPPPHLDSVAELITTFSAGEALFASIFSNEISNTPYADIGIVHYLAAPDIMPKLFKISKKLRLFFQIRNIVLPGLFRTEYGIENICRLHPHQVVSLRKMTEIENRHQDFGALRGGVFADEPGLGKTVTALALISSTAGMSPTNPSIFWDENKINESWSHLKSQHEALLAPILNKLRKSYLLNFDREAKIYEEIKQNLRSGAYTLPSAISAFKHFINVAAYQPSGRDHCTYLFNYEMNGVKERLDSSRRKSLSSVNNRALFERKLFPSAATLIIVPLALLEHWYEQIIRHLQLQYFLHPGDRALMRGVVYLDGLGDIMDVEAPLSKVLLRPSVPIQDADFLSSYLIVITTLERCAYEHRSIDKLNQMDTDLYVTGNSLKDQNNKFTSRTVNSTSLAARSPLMGIRWLRMIVDEGHEIGRLANDPAISRAFAHAGEMISQIAAERRWIMSGTPTTGAQSEVGLYQLFQILSFLRHPLYTSMDGQQTDARWRKEVVEPCLLQEPEAWENIKSLLREIMVRHTKQDIHLFEPIHTTVNLDGMPDPTDPVEEARMLRVDRAKANYIVETIQSALREWRTITNSPNFRHTPSRRSLSHSLMGGSPTKILDEEDRRQQEILFKSRRPKAIVFSQHWSDLQGVGHFLYMMLGESHVCEHTGQYQSAELSRFRHSKRKCRICPMCGHRNLISTGTECDQRLLLVEYIDVPAAVTNNSSSNGNGNNAAPAFVTDDMLRPFPAGHGRYSWGGHYNGRCLCSPEGCVMPCLGIPNPFFTLGDAQNNLVSPHLAIIAEDQVQNHLPGLTPPIGSEVFVMSSEPCPNVHNITSVDDAPIPKLWYGGRRGGRAIVRQFRRCGGRNLYHCWHGNKILPKVPWTINDEDASILLLQHDGSTGLDLSFATHIFLLERISDPALRNQLVSRAHRVGATGPVTVSLLQVVATEDEPDD